MSKRVSLKQYQALEAELEHFRSLVRTFYTGELPEHATVHHFVMRTWGEKRRETLRPTPVLLKSADPV